MIALQTLYEWDFDDEKNAQEVLERNIRKSGFRVDDDFCNKIVNGVIKNFEKINQLIEKTAPEWPLQQIASIDRAVLRMGIFELIFDDEVPPKAAINEAVELGKEFGSENSGKFVNGVLGTIYRSSDRYEKEDLAIGSGGIVFKEEDGQLQFLLIKNPFDKWTFPKGKVKEDETWQEAAAREIGEETGIKQAEILEEVGEIKFTDKSKEEPIKKSIYFYLVKTDQKEITPNKDSDTKEVKWMSEEDVIKSLGYPNLVDIFKKALEKIKKINNK